MFDQEAIQHLQQGASITQAYEALNDTPVSGTMIALPENYSLHDLEPYLQERRRARGVMTTESLTSFVDYTKAHAEDGASVFINVNDMSATSVLNLGSPTAPGQTDNSARYAPHKTAAYIGLTATANGVARKQADIAEFFEDWPGHLSFYAGTEEITPPKAIAAIRKLTIESMKKLESSEQQLSATKSAFESVQASSETPIPTTVYFKCQPYNVLSERLFVLRLAIYTGNNNPTISLRIQTFERHQEEMGKELAEVIGSNFKAAESDLPILLGRYAKS